MRATVYILGICAALVAVAAAPAPDPAANPEPQPDPADDRPEIIEIIAPAASAQETLATLNLGAPGSELSERNKRTIGILRQLFPTLTQIIEQKVQQITSFVLQTFGPVLLRTFLGNRNGGNMGGGGGTVELADDDDDDDDDDDVTVQTRSGLDPRSPSTNSTPDPDSDAGNSDVDDVTVQTTAGSDSRSSSTDSTPDPDSEADNSDVAENTVQTNVGLDSRSPSTNSTPDPDSEADNSDVEENTVQTNVGLDSRSPSTNSTPDPDADADDDASTTESVRRRRRALFFLPNAIAEENQLLSGAESQQAEVRVAFGEGQDQQAAASEDQLTAAQTNAATIDEISLDDGDISEENRNKRFLSFGGGAGGAGGGSGNFLFDIVRRPAEAVARAAGSAFRLFSGTDSLNVGLTASHTATLDPNNPQLVAGSSSGSSGGDAAAEGDDNGGPKGDNLTEGVPGPITRLFIIANRGIANLIQDLILRIAQTSERIVNFKARLITSII